MNSLPATNPSEFAPLVCIERIEETANAATFVFQTTDAAPINFKAGQFVVFQVDVADETLHRAYSLSSSPNRAEKVSIAVKRVPGGKVSNHLLDYLQPGHVLRAWPPAGEFNIIDKPSTENILLFSAGCGITPCMAIARWLLESQPSANIHFIHSAYSGAEVIMAKELDRLQREHGNFHLSRVLETPACAEDLIGPIDAALFNELVPDIEDRTIFTCGPEGYMNAIRGFAAARGLDMRYFHQESFLPAKPETANDAKGVEERYALHAPRFGKQSEIQSQQTLLEALEGAGLPIIGACRSGVCGSCKCQVTSGETESTSVATLSEAEISAGFVLACSSKARSDLVVAL